MTLNLLHQHRDPAWLAAMTDWVRASLAARGAALVATPGVVRVLPWSAVFRCHTTAGDVYFKACAPSQAFEPALMRYLAERRPDDVLPVLAADLERAWLLLPDGGTVLRHTLTGTADDLVAHWSAILPRLAALQVALAGDAAHLLSLGVMDRRPAILPALYDAVLADTDRWPLDHPDGLSPDDLPRLRAFAPRLSSLCEELDALGPADTLIHDDLHDGHIFVTPQAGGRRYRFFDFGDACVGHPFFQMIAPQRFYDAVLADTDRWPLDHPDGLSPDDLPRLRAFAPRLSSLCEELDALGPADTLIHDDLHDGHIFVTPQAGGRRYRFFDFGDACVGHPFFQMIAPQRFYAHAYDDLELDDTAVDSLYEIYLRGWGEVTPQRRRALALALAVGPLIRALTWYHALGPHYPDIAPELMGWYARGMGYWLSELMNRAQHLS